MRRHIRRNTKTILLSIHIFCVSVNAQVSEKIPATTIIGTALSIDYSTETPSTTVNVKSNAFDDDLDTYFASYERSGTWVGLDLGEKYIITKIAYAPRRDDSGWPQRLLLGIFEGANNPDFSDAVPLFMVTDTLFVFRLVEQEVNCSRGFRYVRYVGPNNAQCRIAEIAFYGYKGAGNNAHFYQPTNLPTITLSTTGAVKVTDKELYVDGFVSIIHNGTIYSDIMEIRGRGHFSWDLPKTPYRIKLRNKTNVLGLPARERSWTLISNYRDKTLMRNLLAFDLSKRVELSYTPAGIPVDVILNGEYQGNYQLCDQIEVAPGRVEVQEMSAADVVLPNLSGGYLLEVDGWATLDPDGWFLSDMFGTSVKIRSPKADEIVSQQLLYIHQHYNQMEEALFAANYKDPLYGYRRYIDTESFIRLFLVGEITGNTDTFWSTYMYKDRNKDIFKFGPVWDFDFAYDNDDRTYPVNTHPEWTFEYGSFADGFRYVVWQLLSDEKFVAELKTAYAGYRDRGVITKETLLQVVDDYVAELERSQRLNFIRWDILNKPVPNNPRVYDSYEEEVNHVKNYILERIDWMDKKLDYTVGNTTLPASLSNITVYAQANAICFGNVSEPAHITVVDVTGNVHVSTSIHENTAIPVAKGLYIVLIHDTKDNRKAVKCLVLG